MPAPPGARHPEYVSNKMDAIVCFTLCFGRIPIHVFKSAINQAFHKADTNQGAPYLYKAALHYYASYMASLLSFEDLFAELEKYIADENERWKECVKAKRGLHDTSILSGMYKD